MQKTYSKDNRDFKDKKKRDEDFGPKGLVVKVKYNDVNRALRKLKKMVAAEGIMQELRNREAFEKPSVRRKREKAQAVKRWHKKQAELKLNA